MNSFFVGQSTITVSSIYVEDLFSWFFSHVFSAGGDGAGAIVCKNFLEASEYFLEWYEKRYERKFFLPPETTYNQINFHNSNENFIFTNDASIRLSPGDYVFHVCRPCCSSGAQKKTIFPIKEYM